MKLQEGGGTTNGCSERRHLRHVPGRAARGEADARKAAAQLPAGSAIMYHQSGAEVKSNRQAAGHLRVADVMRQRVDGRRLHEMPTIEHQPCIDKYDVIEAA